VAANKAAHQKLMASARGSAPPAPKARTVFNLDLTPLKQAVKTRLGNNSQSLFASAPASSDSQESIRAKVSTKLSTFKDFVKATDFLNGVLGPLGLVCVLGAIVLTPNRRRLLITISAAILIIALLQIIGVKAVRPTILSHIQDQSFRPAVGVVYDSLTANFKRSATLVTIVSALIMVVALLTQKRFLNRSQFVKHQLKLWTASRVYGYTQELRFLIKQYLWWLAGLLTLTGLVLGAFVFNLDWQGIIRLALFTILSIELVGLIAIRQSPKGAPMK
jgi:hypothetical protein